MYRFLFLSFENKCNVIVGTIRDLIIQLVGNKMFQDLDKYSYNKHYIEDPLEYFLIMIYITLM